MVHIQILDTYHSSILSRGLFQWSQSKKVPFFWKNTENLCIPTLHQLSITIPQTRLLISQEFISLSLCFIFLFPFKHQFFTKLFIRPTVVQLFGKVVQQFKILEEASEFPQAYGN